MDTSSGDPGECRCESFTNIQGSDNETASNSDDEDTEGTRKIIVHDVSDVSKPKSRASSHADQRAEEKSPELRNFVKDKKMSLRSDREQDEALHVKVALATAEFRTAYHELNAECDKMRSNTVNYNEIIKRKETQIDTLHERIKD